MICTKLEQINTEKAKKKGKYEGSLSEKMKQNETSLEQVMKMTKHMQTIIYKLLYM